MSVIALACWLIACPLAAQNSASFPERTLPGKGLSDGSAFARQAGSGFWGIIDSLENFAVSPRYAEVDHPGFLDGLAIVAVPDSVNPKTKDGRDNYRWGVVNTSGMFVVAPRFAKARRTGCGNDLIFVVEDSTYGYIDRTGEYVWKAVDPRKLFKKPSYLDTFSTTRMLPGVFYARSSNKNVPSYYPNWGSSPKRIEDFDRFEPYQLAVEVRPDEPDTVFYDESFGGAYPQLFHTPARGMKAYLYNTTDAAVHLGVQDSRLYLKIEAVDEDGQWADIMYLDNAECGWSYYSIELGPHEYWSFTIPVFQGERETWLRLVLNDRIYSNAFEGRINPGQFWLNETFLPYDIWRRFYSFSGFPED